MQRLGTGRLQVLRAAGRVAVVTVCWRRAVRRARGEWGAAPQHSRVVRQGRRQRLGGAVHVVDVVEGEVVGEAEEDEGVVSTSSFRRRWGG